MVGVRASSISRIGTRRSAREPVTKILCEPGIGRTTSADSCSACCCSGEGMAFMAFVLWRRGRSGGARPRRGRDRRSSLRRLGSTASPTLPASGSKGLSQPGWCARYPRFSAHLTTRSAARPVGADNGRTAARCGSWGGAVAGLIGGERNRATATAFAPAGIGNIGVRVDPLSHTISGPGDRATVRRIDAPCVRIAAIEGHAKGARQLPTAAELNTAGRALIELRERHRVGHGFELVLHKGIALGSGLGGSAASCVAALVAANALLDQPLSRGQLYPLALVGEAVASGSPAGDNVGPMLFGGIVLATAERVVRLPAPALYCAAVHPDHVVETRFARDALAAPYAI